MYKCFFKRLIDFLIVFNVLLVIWPILLIITIWLHFANKGAGAFFFQERPGKDGKIFKVIKFKSMTDERDADGNLLPNELRITPIGAFIRKTSIDELPQLINVLKGDMALIGPRPLLVDYLPLYIGETLYTKACEVVSAYGEKSGKESESYQHYHFNRNGVTVELHKLATHSPDPFVNKYLQRLVKLYLVDGYAGYERHYDSTLLLPPAQFDACYLFYHLAKHFIYVGIGLRQVCDWILCLHTYADKVDKEQLLKDVRALGMLRLWEIFGCIAVDYLGLPQDGFPGYNALRRVQAKDVVAGILSVGNFGHHVLPEKGLRDKGKLYVFGKRMGWRIRIFRLNPYWVGRMSFFYYFKHKFKTTLLHRC